MAHKTQITVSGMVFDVTEFDNSAQEIDDAVDKVRDGITGVEVSAEEPETGNVWIDTDANELKYKDPETGEWKATGGGSDVVKIAGGATMTLPESFGAGPHTIEVTEEEGEELTPASIGAAPAIIAGTVDVEDGSASPYPEGTLYVVIE